MGGNCSRIESGSMRSIERRKSKNPNFIAGVVEEADRRESRRTKSVLNSNDQGGNGAGEGADGNAAGAAMAASSVSKQLKKSTTAVSKRQSQLTSEESKKKVSQQGSSDEDESAKAAAAAAEGSGGEVRKKKAMMKSQTESIFSRKEKSAGSGEQPILVRIEQQRSKCEQQVKESIADLNLEKHSISSIFQLLRDYLSHIKDTKKYWVSMKLLGHSKVEVNSAQVSGSLSIVVEYNTGEMTKLRIVHSKEMEKANFDLDTFVTYSKLEQKSLIRVSDFNLRISPKFMRYYIFSESVYHECSLQAMIAVQAKTEKPQMTCASFTEMFADLLDVLTYFSSMKFTHGGIRPANIYVSKQLQADGRFMQKAHLDLSLAANSYNRRNTKFRDFAFRKSNDLQMFAISMLSFISSMDIHAISEPHRKSIVVSKLSAPSILVVGNDIRYALSCILKGSDMILEFGARELSADMKAHSNFTNNLNLIRPMQTKTSFGYCCNLNENGFDFSVYSFFTKWAFGFRMYESLENDRQVRVISFYCSGDSVYMIFECEDSSDLFLTSINLKKKCLDIRIISLIKSLAVAVCKFQGVTTEEEIDMVRAFENFDTSNSGFVDSDSIMQFALENRIKDVVNNGSQSQADINAIIGAFDEHNSGKLSFFEFRNMLQFIMNSRPFMSFQVKTHVDLPRHYRPAAIIKKSNYLYLVGGTYASIPTNKCFRFFLKNLHETQEISLLDSHSAHGFLMEPSDQPNKLIYFSWKNAFSFEEIVSKNNESNLAFSSVQSSSTKSQQQVVSINLNEALRSAAFPAADAHLKKKQNILKFQNSAEMHNAMLSQKSFSNQQFNNNNNNNNNSMIHRSLSTQIRLDQAMSFPVILDFEDSVKEDNPAGVINNTNTNDFTLNVYNIDKNRWSKCSVEGNSILNRENFFMPLHSSGQVLIFEKENIQTAWIMRVSLQEVVFEPIPLFFEDRNAVLALIHAYSNQRVNVAFYENSLLVLAKSPVQESFFYGVFIISEVTGVVRYHGYELLSYLSKYERVSKAVGRFEAIKKPGSISYMMNQKGGLKMKVGRYTADKLLAGFGETMIFSGYRASMPGVEVRILSRVVNNTTEKIDDVYETVKFLTENRLSGRMAPLRDSFFVFDPTASHIKINLLYTSEDVGASMAMIVSNLISERDEARKERIQSRASRTKVVRIGSNSQSIMESKKGRRQSQQQSNNNNNNVVMSSGSSTHSFDSQARKMRKKRNLQKTPLVEYPARLHELIRSLRNVLICVHYMQQQRFYLKEVSPHTLVRVREGKFFSPVNFYHETTFTTINSETSEPVLSRESAAFEDFLPPQLKKAHDDGLSLTEVSYNLHKANIFSLGLVFLHYAGISRKPHQLHGVDAAAQLRLSKVIHSLPFPKYVQNILSQMLKFNEDERSNAAVLLDQLAHIVDNHRIEIYFPQLSTFSAFNEVSNSKSETLSQSTMASATSSGTTAVMNNNNNYNSNNSTGQNSDQDFFYQFDQSKGVLLVGGKHVLVEFRKQFRIIDFNNNMVVDMSQIVGIVRFSQGFYAVVKFLQEPMDEIDIPQQSTLKYVLVRLVGLPANPKQLQGFSLGVLSQFSGRDIIHLTLFDVDEKRVLIAAGQEKSSIGVMNIREVYSCNVNRGANGNQFVYEDYEDDEEFRHLDPSECQYVRLDDFKSPVMRGHVIKYDPMSVDHRKYDPDSPLDGEEPSIFERSEEEENDDSTRYDHTQLDEIVSYENSDDEEESKDNANGMTTAAGGTTASQGIASSLGGHSRNEIEQARQDKRRKQKKWEYYVLDQITRTSRSNEKKRLLMLQTIRLDGSVETNTIGVQFDKCVCQSRHKPQQQQQQQRVSEQQQQQDDVSIEYSQSAATLTFVPLTDSLVVAFDLSQNQCKSCMAGAASNSSSYGSAFAAAAAGKTMLGTAYLISLISFKSMRLPIINENMRVKSTQDDFENDEDVRIQGNQEDDDDVAFDLFMNRNNNSSNCQTKSQFLGKGYSIISEKCFSLVFENDGHLYSNSFELDSQNLVLHFLSKTCILRDYCMTEAQREDARIAREQEKTISKATTTNQSSTKSNKSKILLPKLTMEVEQVPNIKDSSKQQQQQAGQSSAKQISKKLSSEYSGSLRRPNSETPDSTFSPKNNNTNFKQIDQISEANEEEEVQSMFQREDDRERSQQNHAMFAKNKKKLAGSIPKTKLAKIDSAGVEFEEMEDLNSNKHLNKQLQDGHEEILSIIKQKVDTNKQQYDEISLEPSQNSSAIRATPIPPFKPTQQQIDFYSGRLGKDEEDQEEEEEKKEKEEIKQIDACRKSKGNDVSSQKEKSSSKPSFKNRISPVKKHELLPFSQQNQQRIVGFKSADKQDTSLDRLGGMQHDDDEEEDDDDGFGAGNDDFNMGNFNQSFDHTAFQNNHDMLMVLEDN